jgi:hypothetical protein
MRTDRTWTIGEVAHATGVQRPTLLSWTQRGHLQFLDERRPGEFREFDTSAVAYTAAFAVLADYGSAMDAARIMERATNRQGAYWQKAIAAAVDGTRVNLLVKKYRYNGVLELDAEVQIGPGLEAQRDAFANATRSGVRLSGNINISEAASDPVMVIDIGGAIAGALKVLPSA